MMEHVLFGTFCAALRSATSVRALTSKARLEWLRTATGGGHPARIGCTHRYCRMPSIFSL